MLIARPRRGLFFPPGAVPALRDDHPARGLVQAAYLFGPRPLAIVPGFGGLSALSGTTAPAIGRTGVYISYTAASGQQAITGPSGAFSLVVVAMRAINPGGGTTDVPVALTTLQPTGSTAAWEGFEFELGNVYLGTPNRLVVQRHSGGVVGQPPDAIWIDGAKSSTASITSSTDLANGVWYGTGCTFTNVSAGNTPLTFGRFDNGLFAMTGGIQAAYFFRSVLPDGLMSELTASPADLLEWPDDWPIYHFLARRASLNSYTLPLSPGLFTLTGQPVALKAGRRLPLSAGSVAITGQPVGLKVGRRLGLAAGTIALSGQAVALRAGRRLTLGAGSVAITGQPVGLRVGRRLALATGSFVLTGRAISLIYSGGATINLVASRHIVVRAPGTPRARAASTRLTAPAGSALRGPGEPS